MHIHELEVSVSSSLKLSGCSRLSTDASQRASPIIVFHSVTLSSGERSSAAPCSNIWVVSFCFRYHRLVLKIVRYTGGKFLCRAVNAVFQCSGANMNPPFSGGANYHTFFKPLSSSPSLFCLPLLHISLFFPLLSPPSALLALPPPSCRGHCGSSSAPGPSVQAAAPVVKRLPGIIFLVKV